MKTKRSFGWIQNPSNFRTLKMVTGIFSPESRYRKILLDYRLPMLRKNNRISEADYLSIIAALDNQSRCIPYDVLKGRGAGKLRRSEAMCSGIVQACCDGQKTVEYLSLENEKVKLHKLYSDDWTADGFLRWAISIGLISYDYSKDTCAITELGEALIKTEDESEEESLIFTEALLSYPPVCRVLQLLSEAPSLTKFEIGNQLGFIGELGFTSISQAYFIALYQESDQIQRRSIKSNIEGDSYNRQNQKCNFEKRKVQFSGIFRPSHFCRLTAV